MPYFAPNLPGLLLPRKLKFFVNYFFGPILFIGIAFSIYRQVLHQENLSQKWQAILYSLDEKGVWMVLAVILLMFVNWSIESLKWKVLLSHLFTIKFTQALKSVFSGVAFTMVTPNRMGEFIGRVFYVPDGSRIRAAALTLVGSASQLIITLLGGAIGLLSLKKYLNGNTSGMQGLSVLWLNGLVGGTIIVLVFLVFTCIYAYIHLTHVVVPSKSHSVFV